MCFCPFWSIIVWTPVSPEASLTSCRHCVETLCRPQVVIWPPPPPLLAGTRFTWLSFSWLDITGEIPVLLGSTFFNSHIERRNICLNLLISARAVSIAVCPWFSTKSCRWDMNPGSGCRRWTIRILAICCVPHNLKFISQSSVLATHSHGIFIMMCNIVLHDSCCRGSHFERRKCHYLYHITLTLPRWAEPSFHLTKISSCPLPIFFSFKMYFILNYMYGRGARAGACRGQKRSPDLLELEFKQLWAASWECWELTTVLCKSSMCS